MEMISVDYMDTHIQEKVLFDTSQISGNEIHIERNKIKHSYIDAEINYEDYIISLNSIYDVTSDALIRASLIMQNIPIEYRGSLYEIFKLNIPEVAQEAVYLRISDELYSLHWYQELYEPFNITLDILYKALVYPYLVSYFTGETTYRNNTLVTYQDMIDSQYDRYKDITLHRYHLVEEEIEYLNSVKIEGD